MSLKSYDTSIFISIERFQKRERKVLFDFLDSNSFSVFTTRLNFGYNWTLKPTMVEVINYNQHKVTEGTVYEIPPESIPQLAERLEIIEDSFIIGFRLTLHDDDIILFGKNRSFNVEEKFLLGIERGMSIPPSNFDFKWQQSGYVNIRNIGQGSWNEIYYEDKCKIIFDSGTIYTKKKSEIQFLLGQKNEEYQSSKPLLILSHWDVDHYHFLLAMADDTIKSFPIFICRGHIPNLTARKVMGRFEKLNSIAVCYLAPLQTRKGELAATLACIPLSPCRTYLLFNAPKNRSRNKSGIGLGIRNKNTSVVFAADFDYIQASNGMLPHFQYSCNHYLIVPHHGGNAGKPIYNISTKFNLKDAIISVGKNPYSPPHPYEKNIRFLQNTGFNIIRTDRYNGDYKFSF